MSIFKAYDIRGVYPGELDEEMAGKIGLAFGKLFGGAVAVGMDMRLSSPSLKAAFLAGLHANGSRVFDIGVVPTPLVYFAAAFSGFDAAVNVTASHNPKEFNGFKFCRKGGVCLSYETGIAEMEKMVAGASPAKVSVKAETKDLVGDYVRYCLSKAALMKPLKVVIDAGNGTAGIVAPGIFRGLGCDVVEMYCEPDGDFPNHTPDPLVKANLRDLQKRVVEAGADLGIAYDGDGDRVGFVDSEGKVIESNDAFALFAKSALSTHKGAPVVFDVSCSSMIEDVIRLAGGKPVACRVGHSYIQQAMLEKGCVLGGETSGHYYFRENFSYDDGIFASLKFAEIASRLDIRKEVGALPKYHTSDDTRVRCEDGRKFLVVEEIRRKLAAEGHRIIDMDGVKVVFDDGWALMRASNTQPAIVTRWEAKDRESFDRIGSFVREAVGHATG
ncbi:MAG: phosphomannomutase/phosphoglucomutase [Candidatus Aenigmarchaeota archaeon]|nr:phosphomannomutase/phosphoglucomutase [Candidatus Aenigmarchaeota archaeon]